MGFRGIAIQNSQNFIVGQNIIAGVYDGGTTISNMSGIAVYTNINTGTISQNKISDVKHSAALGAHGILLDAATTASNLTVVNNFVFDIAAAGRNGFTSSDNGYGIVADLGGGYKIYYNTVVLNTNQTNTSNSLRSAALLVSAGIVTAGSLDIQNNIFGNLETNCANLTGSYAFVSAAANTVYANLNYNAYYRPQLTNGAIACKANNTNYNSLAAIQLSIGGNAYSVVYAAPPVPAYTSPTDYHLQSIAANGFFSNLGTPIAGITIDYDTTTRNGLTPDIGADEWLMPNTGSWVGKTSIDWLVNTNWETNTIPTGTTDVVISGGYNYMPTIVTTQAVRGLELKAPVPANTPILTLSNGTIQINGTIIRSAGTIDGVNGTVEMNGTAAQTIPAGLFNSNNLKNLVIGNNTAAGVTIGGTLDIYRSLTFSATGLKLITGNFLTFKSKATETAWLGDVTGKTIIGNATIERYIPTGINHGKSWQLLAVPVSGTQSVKASWQENQNPTVIGINNYGTTISSEKPGATVRGYDFVTAPGPSIKTYDPLTNAFTGIDDGVTYTSGLPIQNQKGYMILVRGDRSVQTSTATATPTTLRTFGRLFTATAGELPPVTAVLPNKFATIGNPYPSAIDFRKITRPLGVDSVFYVWDPLLAGSYTLGGYQTISGITGYYPTPGSTNYPADTPCTTIQSGTAFYVHGIAGGNVSFTEAAKLSGSRQVFRTYNINQRQLLRVNLYKTSPIAPGPADGNVVVFDPSFSNDYESSDALKLINTGENFGILSNDKLLAVEARKPLVSTDTIFYNLSNLRHEGYQFRFGPVNMSSVNLEASLVDRFLGTKTPVSLSDSTFINFSVDSNMASAATGRFYLVFNQVLTIPVTIKYISATRVSDNKITVDWKVEHESGIQQYDIERSGDGRNFNKLSNTSPLSNTGISAAYSYPDVSPFEADNYYRIKALSHDGHVIYSDIVKVEAVKKVSVISVYPNPVVNKKLMISFVNQQAGEYNIRLSNKLGQILYNGEIKVSGTNESRIIPLGDDFAAGTYQLVIGLESGAKLTQQVIIQ